MASLDFRILNGYAFGAQQPSAVLTFDAASQLPLSPNGVMAQLVKHIDLPPVQDTFTQTLSNVSQTASATEMLRLVAYLNIACGDQRFTKITAIKDGNRFAYYLPGLVPKLSAQNLKAIIEFSQKHKDGFSNSQCTKFIENCANRGKPLLPYGRTAKSFISAAGAYKVPLKIMSSQYLALSYGCGSSIFHSSISDHESQIGASIASDKAHANDFLKTMGLPVADQTKVDSAKSACAAARKCGYPVILKPVDEEQGRGVVVDIRNDAELSASFDKLSKSYKRLVVENFVVGELYRINTLDGVYIRALQRVPTRVVGDGASTIEELIKTFNTHPIRNDPESYTEHLPIDDELLAFLARQSLTLKSILESGRIVTLTTIWKSSRGGHSEDFTDQLHPDNIELCETVARAFRLSLTGIDLLSPDASVSWRDNNAIICEVNVRPQLGISHPDVFRQILAKRLGPSPKINIRISASGERNLSSLFDPSADIVTLQLSAAEVLMNGCPTQYFSSLDISDDVSVSDREKLEDLLISVPPMSLDLNT